MDKLTGMDEEASGPVGMAEIAALAGVAVSTVSRALSGAAGVSAPRRAKILDIARSTGYLAPSGGTRRRPHDNPRIAVILPESDRWVFGSILAGLHDILTDEDAHLTVLQGLSSSQRVRMLRSADLPRRFDGVVLVPMPRATTGRRLAALPVPVVVAGTAVDGIASVGVDDLAVGQKAVNYLINTGRRRIAYAAYADHDGTPGIASQNRARGFELSMERAGLDPTWQLKVPFGPDSGRLAAERLLEGDHFPDAVFVTSDEMAASMMTVLRRAGVKIPDDIAVIGVDDHPIADMVGLTTLAQPVREQGRVGATLALHAIHGNAQPNPIVLPTRLIVRESTSRDVS